jgi:hypothetical protein
LSAPRQRFADDRRNDTADVGYFSLLISCNIFAAAAKTIAKIISGFIKITSF